MLSRAARAAVKRGERPRKKTAITLAELEAMLATCDDSLEGLRDCALLCFGFSSGGRRRSEIAAADLTSTDSSLVEDEISRRVVDHFKSTYSSKLRQFANWNYQVIPSATDPLLICDRPMFDMTTHRLKQDMLVIPLAPSLMLVATPPSDRARKNLKLTVSDRTSSKIVTLANEFTVERARQFVVGFHDQLKVIQPRFDTSEFQKRKATDRLVLEPQRY